MSRSPSDATSSDSARSRTTAGAIGPPAPRTATASSPCVKPGASSRHQLSRLQREPELDPVAGTRQVPPGELLDAADPVAERVAVAEDPPSALPPPPVLLQERLQRLQQLAAVLALAILDRAEHAVAVEPQRLVVLDREQQLERAQVSPGGHVRRTAVRERRHLEGVPGLVERGSKRDGG